MRTFNLKKCLKELRESKLKRKYDFESVTLAYNTGLDKAIKIIKSNIQEKPEIRSAPDTMINSQYTSVRGWK
jgi:hypothetical protein